MHYYVIKGGIFIVFKEYKKRILILLSIMSIIYIGYLMLLTVVSETTKIEIVTSDRDTFIVYEHDNSFLDISYDYNIYEKIPGKIFDKKIPVLNVNIHSNDNNLTKEDFFYTCTKYKYKNKKVKVYISKDQCAIIFKVEGEKNYIYAKDGDIVSEFLNNKGYKYKYLTPIYMKRLKNAQYRFN